MTQSKEALDRFYSKGTDPWHYKSNYDDRDRRSQIVEACLRFAPPEGYFKALDIGCGEGFVTSHLPAASLYGYEISDVAASRLPPEIVRLADPMILPKGSFDLVTACGILYRQYDWGGMTDAITHSASGIVVTCNIKAWERNRLPNEKLVYEAEFPYRDFIQHLCVYDFNENKQKDYDKNGPGFLPPQ